MASGLLKICRFTRGWEASVDHLLIGVPLTDLRLVGVDHADHWLAPAHDDQSAVDRGGVHPGSSTRRSMSAALSFPAWAALSKRRRPACAEVPVVYDGWVFLKVLFQVGYYQAWFLAKLLGSPGPFALTAWSLRSAWSQASTHGCAGDQLLDHFDRDPPALRGRAWSQTPPAALAGATAPP